VRAIKEETVELITKGNVIHSGKTTATSEARITDRNGKLYAHASCTCLKIKLKKRQKVFVYPPRN
jgi:acyl-coenzyme A thioesterase PaaI-like protein